MLDVGSDSQSWNNNRNSLWETSEVEIATFSSTHNHTFANLNLRGWSAVNPNLESPRFVPASSTRSQEQGNLRSRLRSQRRRPVDRALASLRASISRRRRYTGSSSLPAYSTPVHSSSFEQPIYGSSDQGSSDNMGDQSTTDAAEQERRMARRQYLGSPKVTEADLRDLHAHPRISPLTKLDLKFQVYDQAQSNREIRRELIAREAVAVMLYRKPSPNPVAHDIWPHYRTSSDKMPTEYLLLDSAGAAVGSDCRQQEALDDAVNHDTAGRPKWKLPLELVKRIAGYLDRDDMRSLRFVSQELNFFAAQVLFKTVVVPFNTNIYGRTTKEPQKDVKGKQPVYDLSESDSNAETISQGLDVFQGFGKHIEKFGMSFEVAETSLANIPCKKRTQIINAFWGDYEWPCLEYPRFDEVARLENIADDTARMTEAFSELTKVKELALSLDNGLGWLDGPDKSARSRILQQPPAVFGTLKEVPDRRTQAQREFWEYLERVHKGTIWDIKYATLYRLDGATIASSALETSALASKQPKLPYLDPHITHAAPAYTSSVALPESCDKPESMDSLTLMPPEDQSGILFTASVIHSGSELATSPVIPNGLNKDQSEWLMETEWAQRAFLTSYMLSVMDNKPIFANIETLNISRLPSSYLKMLDRSDFWDSLPQLRDLTIQVIPCWRTVTKDVVDNVESANTPAPSAVQPLYDLLKSQIVCRANIQKLTLGWVGGGEHAEGQFARNLNLMPSPLTPLFVRGPTVASREDIKYVESPEILRHELLQMPHVEHLTLRNCWVTSPALLHFIKCHDNHSLQHLTLDSVSLTGGLRREPVQVPFTTTNHAVTMAILNHAVPASMGILQSAPNAGIVLTLREARRLITLGIRAAIFQPALTGPPPVGSTPAQQLQQQIAHVFAQVQHNLPPIGLANPVPQLIPQVRPPLTIFLSNPPEEDHWASLIDMVSPGLNLSHVGSKYSCADPNRKTNLHTIEFISCGYANVEPLLDDDYHPNTGAANNLYFAQRRRVLQEFMQKDKSGHLGTVTQYVDGVEYEGLKKCFNMTLGWDDKEAARAAEFDGAMPGGTGRFSGFLRKSDLEPEA